MLDSRPGLCWGVFFSPLRAIAFRHPGPILHCDGLPAGPFAELTSHPGTMLHQVSALSFRLDVILHRVGQWESLFGPVLVNQRYGPAPDFQAEILHDGPVRGLAALA